MGIRQALTFCKRSDVPVPFVLSGLIQKISMAMSGGVLMKVICCRAETFAGLDVLGSPLAAGSLNKKNRYELMVLSG